MFLRQSGSVFTSSPQTGRHQIKKGTQIVGGDTGVVGVAVGEEVVPELLVGVGIGVAVAGAGVGVGEGAGLVGDGVCDGTMVALGEGRNPAGCEADVVGGFLRGPCDGLRRGFAGRWGRNGTASDSVPPESVAGVVPAVEESMVGGPGLLPGVLDAVMGAWGEVLVGSCVESTGWVGAPVAWMNRTKPAVSVIEAMTDPAAMNPMLSPGLGGQRRRDSVETGGSNGDRSRTGAIRARMVFLMSVSSAMTFLQSSQSRACCFAALRSRADAVPRTVPAR